jgi:UDP-N-acetylglucosamine 2-epimerase (non-hydrolysing)
MSEPFLEHDPACRNPGRETDQAWQRWLASETLSEASSAAPQTKPTRPQASLLICVGTRPEIIKMAPVYQALRARGVKTRWLHTGQHDAMAWPLYDFFSISPDHVIKLERANDSLSELSATLLRELDREMQQNPPAGVVVHGDTTSAAMAALAAFYRRLPVAHVEAGLRSNHPADPFPEEMNRRLIGRLAEWHFAPTTGARANLLRESIDEQQVFVVGNTVVDATRQALANIDAGRSGPTKHHRTLVITAHRRENWGERLAQVAQAVLQLLNDDTELHAVWPLHGNPKVANAVRAVIETAGPSLASRICLTEPLPYADMIRLMADSWLILTDSGGIQEEACALHVPVLVLRDTTERPELIDAGAGLMVGTSAPRIVNTVRALRQDESSYRAMTLAPNPFGDGQSALRIAAVLHAWLSPDAQISVEGTRP